MWSPYIVHHSEMPFQVEPLDLSMKKQEKQQTVQHSGVKSQETNFDFWMFYQTYHQISSRSWSAYPGDQDFLHPSQTSPSNTRKRKSSSSKEDSDDSESGDGKKIRLECPNINNKSNNSHKKKKIVKVNHIASIKDSCDCRFCYEDHIFKMRIKTKSTWKTPFFNNV